MASTFQSRGGTRRPGAAAAVAGAKAPAGAARNIALRRTTAPIVREPLTLPSVLTVADLAEQLQTTGIEVIKELMKLGMMANINQQIDFDTAHRVATALGWESSESVPEVVQQAVADFASRRTEADSDPEAVGRRRS
jgi:translation initiation factor IF-2